MALVLKRLYQGYFWIFTEKADPRPGDIGLPLMSSPLYPLAIIFCYFYFIYNLGPKLMENRKPYDLKKVLIAYNAIQIVSNLYIFYEIYPHTESVSCVFFVLRKRYRQVSFLHVYHHFGMFTMLWVAVKFFAGGHGSWVGLINSFVHAVIYNSLSLS
nr:unnamed protein product [Callosobruchus chinensis]